MAKTVTLRLPKPHSDGQNEILTWPGHGVVFAGRRWGKTQIACQRLLAAALERPGLYWWVGLSWRSASLKRAWRVLKDYTRQVWKLVKADPTRQIREVDKELHLPNGGEIWLRTAENATSLAGEGVRGVVLDEFSLMQEAVWAEYVQATLLDHGGWALFLGVPKGQNLAANLWRAAQTRKGWRAWRFTTYDNPLIPRAEVDAIRGTVPERLFRQEYLADVVDDVGSVFRHVMECATATAQDALQPGHVYSVGVDWAGPGRDWTAFCVMDKSTGELVHLDRMSRAEFGLQLIRLRALHERFQPATISAEQNALGLPLVEQLQREGLPVIAFQTTNASKQALIDGLVLAFERREIRVLADDVLIGELQAFEAERLPSGAVRYAAPAGLHDDCVMALALAWQRARRGFGPDEKLVY